MTQTDLLSCFSCSIQTWWCVFQHICTKFKFHNFHTRKNSIDFFFIFKNKKFSAFISYNSYLQHSYAFDPIKLSLQQCCFTQCARASQCTDFRYLFLLPFFRTGWQASNKAGTPFRKGKHSLLHKKGN